MAQPTKAELRKEFLERRNAMDTQERRRASSLIRQRLFQHSAWKNASIILCYQSLGSEVETAALIQEAKRFKKKVVVPIHKPTMALEPPIDPAMIELAIIPGIAFDKEGGRIGFGGGYFDKLLPQMPKAFRVALAYTQQMSETMLPLEDHDMKMQAIITEKWVLEIQ
jgi:5-formyltetrahydrofolate cyclo-ligase